VTFRELLAELQKLTPTELDQPARFCEPYDSPATHEIAGIGMAWKPDDAGEELALYA
jgi:hypothetical protein